MILAFRTHLLWSTINSQNLLLLGDVWLVNRLNLTTLFSVFLTLTSFKLMELIWPHHFQVWSGDWRCSFKDLIFFKCGTHFNSLIIVWLLHQATAWDDTWKFELIRIWKSYKKKRMKFLRVLTIFVVSYTFGSFPYSVYMMILLSKQSMIIIVVWWYNLI